jgi:hypothetical protein
MKAIQILFSMLSWLLLPILGNSQTQMAAKPVVSYGKNVKAGKYFSTRGIKLYYETYGQGKPLLLIHGNGGSIRDMRYQLEDFKPAKGFV